VTYGTTEGGFRHEAFFYASDEEFLDGTASFLYEGLEAGEPALVVLKREKLDALRSQLGSHGERVLFADMADVGHNPARIIPAWRKFVDKHSDGSRALRGIGEPIYPERGSHELVECQHHESLLNLAFVDAPDFYLMCPYDTVSLKESVLNEAHCSHPFVAHDGMERESTRYRGLDEIASPFSSPLPDPQTHTESCVFQATSLAALRRFVERQAREAELGEAETGDLVLAASEVATNSVVHGSGGGVMRAWNEDGTLICEVGDTGRFDNPMAGRESPAPGKLGGHGLWVANQVCDLVQVRAFAGGTAVRLHMRRR